MRRWACLSPPLARRAEALMQGGAPRRALDRRRDDAMVLAGEYDLTVDRTDLTSIPARLSEERWRPG